MSNDIFLSLGASHYFSNLFVGKAVGSLDRWYNTRTIRSLSTYKFTIKLQPCGCIIQKALFQVQISEDFGLLNVYIFNGEYSIFYLLNHKRLEKSLNVGFRFARVQIKGIWISRVYCIARNFFNLIKQLGNHG